MLELGNINKNLQNFSLNELSEELVKVSKNIDEVLKQQVNNLIAENKKIKEMLNLPVLEDLRAILIQAQEKGLSNSYRKELDTIRKFAKKIIKAHPIRSNIVQTMPDEMIFEILSKMHPKEATSLRTVSKTWDKVAPKANITAINKQPIPIKAAFNTNDAKKAVELLAKNPAIKSLEYADFTGMDGFDNKCLETLTKNCPDLKHLLIKNAGVTDDALKHLQLTPNLERLDISWCTQLREDALENLKHTPKLRSLEIVNCPQFRTLESLKYTHNLRSLNVRACNELQEDALNNLKYTPNLERLDILWCTQLREDALENLKHTPKLERLDVSWCTQLREDALENLKYTPKLRSLEIAMCPQFRTLESLKCTPNLERLDISLCLQLREDALKSLKHIPKLLILNIEGCNQLQPNALESLKHTKNLIYLNMLGCTTFREDALESLKHIPKLLLLNIEGCNQLQPNALESLKHTPKLREVNIAKCNQLQGVEEIQKRGINIIL